MPLRLIRSRKGGTGNLHRLLAEHGSAAAALAALPDMARAAGIGDYVPRPVAVAEAEIAAGQRAGARLLTWKTPPTPLRLRESRGRRRSGGCAAISGFWITAARR